MGVLRVVCRTTLSYLRESSTVGGLSHAAKSNSCCSVTYWLLLFSIGSILTTVQIRDIVSAFLLYGVETATEWTYEAALPFPAVTACNINNINCINLLALMDKEEDVDIGATLKEMLEQTGCREQNCKLISDGMKDMREDDSKDLLPLKYATLLCQNVYLDVSRLWRNHRTCYHLYQMMHFDNILAAKKVWSLSNCSLWSACQHYFLRVKGATVLQKGAELKADCQNVTIPIIPQLTMPNKSKENDFATNFFSLSESTRMLIGHRFDRQDDDVWGIQPGFIRSCVYMEDNCMDKGFWHITNSFVTGNCFTFNPPNFTNKSLDLGKTSLTGATNGLQLEFYVDQYSYMNLNDSRKAGVKVIIHDPKSLPLVDEFGLELRPGASNLIALRRGLVTRLQYPYETNCTGEWKQTSMNLSIMSDNLPQYSMSVCQRHCKQMDIIRECGCYHVQLDMTLVNMSRVPFFSGGTPRHCSLDRQGNNSDRTCVDKVMNEFELMERSCPTCQLQCLEIHYSSTLTTAEWPSDIFWESLALETSYDRQEVFDPTLSAITKMDIKANYLRAEIYYQSLMVRHIRQTEKYTGMSLFSALGGALGFYLGIALVMLFELVELLVLVTIAVYSHCKKIYPENSNQK